MATYYVNSATGNDSTGTGSSGTPWASIGKAGGSVAANDVVYFTGANTVAITTANVSGGPFRPTASGVRLIGLSNATVTLGISLTTTGDLIAIAGQGEVRGLTVSTGTYVCRYPVNVAGGRIGDCSIAGSAVDYSGGGFAATYALRCRSNMNGGYTYAARMTSSGIACQCWFQGGTAADLGCDAAVRAISCLFATSSTYNGDQFVGCIATGLTVVNGNANLTWSWDRCIFGATMSVATGIDQTMTIDNSFGYGQSGYYPATAPSPNINNFTSLGASPFLNSTAGDLRLSAAGKSNPQIKAIIAAMIGTPGITTDSLTDLLAGTAAASFTGEVLR